MVPGMWVTAAPTEPLSRVLDAAEDASPLEAVTGALGAEAAFFLGGRGGGAAHPEGPGRRALVPERDEQRPP